MRSLGCACLRFPGLISQRLCASRQQRQPCASGSRQLPAFVALLACPIPPPPALLVGCSRLRSSRRRCPTLPPLPSQTGRAYGERPPLTLSPHIYPELEAFMDKWRAALQPRHNLLFTQ